LGWGQTSGVLPVDGGKMLRQCGFITWKRIEERPSKQIDHSNQFVLLSTDARGFVNEKIGTTFVTLSRALPDFAENEPD
jgi:hypothetical protein